MTNIPVRLAAGYSRPTPLATSAVKPKKVNLTLNTGKSG
jgi:hypothetical protein